MRAAQITNLNRLFRISKLYCCYCYCCCCFLINLLLMSSHKYILSVCMLLCLCMWTAEPLIWKKEYYQKPLFIEWMNINKNKVFECIQKKLKRQKDGEWERGRRGEWKHESEEITLRIRTVLQNVVKNVANHSHPL